MPNCAAIGCTSRSSVDKDVSFHRIPPKKKNELRKKWLANIKRAGDLPKDISFYICSKHFESRFLQRDLKVITSFVYLYKIV